MERLGIDFGAILPNKLSFLEENAKTFMIFDHLQGVHVNPKGGRRDPALRAEYFCLASAASRTR